MDRNETEPIAKDLIDKARELMKDVNVTFDEDFWAYTAFDRKWRRKPEFCCGKKKELLDQIYDVIGNLDYNSTIHLFAHITSAEIAAELQMKAKDGWKNPAALDKKACILLRNVRSKVEYEKSETNIKI